MKLGYSLLLGEYVTAEKIDYLDCKNFQIVCPNCKEPIFKVERQKEPQVIHYLCHYNRDKSYVDICELRVIKISQNEIQSENNISREQKLEYFLKVLKDAILQNEYPNDPVNLKAVKDMFNKLNHSAGIQILRDTMHNLSREQFLECSNNVIYELFDEYINEIELISGSFPKTSFSIEMQKRIATDIWKHLLSPNAKGNYFYLFSHGYISLIKRIEEADNTRPLRDFEKEIHYNMMELINSSKHKAREIFENLFYSSIGPPYAIENSNLLNKMSAEIAHEMLGCLIRLPYFETIKGAIF